MKKPTLLSLALAGLILTACHQSRENSTSQETKTAFELTLTSSDSTEVVALLDQYFAYAISGGYYEAAAMLYYIDENGEPLLLDNDRMQQVVGLLESVPVVSYEVEYMKFSTETENEVMCDVVIAEATEDHPAMKTRMAFMPARFLGNWILCLPNFETGTGGIVKGSDRDSLREEFSRHQVETPQP